MRVEWRPRALIPFFLLLTIAACSGPERSVIATTTPSIPSATATHVAQTPTATTIPSPTPRPTITPTPEPTTPTPAPAHTPTSSPTVQSKPASQTIDLPDVDTHYTLDITSLDLRDNVVDVDERIEIKSNQGYIPTLYFTVTTAKWGYFNLASVSIDDVAVTPESLNDGFTLALSPRSGEHWTVHFVFELKLSQVPKDWYGTGMDGSIMRLGYWFPILSTNFPYPSTADPAYTRSATFDVSLPLPEGVPFVSTGSETRQEKIDAGHSRHYLHADNVRDFALVIAPGDRVDEVQTSNGVTIRLMSGPSSSAADREAELSAAKRTIETLSRLIGPYPYPVFSMAEAGPSLPGGIEFPAMIDLNRQIKPIDRLVYHETAHQWLYGIIGTRPQQDIWIDEGGAQFIEGFLDTGSDLPTPPAGGYPYPLDSSDSELPQGEGIPGYASIYFQGQRFYQAVLTTMGSDAFWSAMQDLYEHFKFDIVTPWDVLSAWQAHSSVDLRPLFASTFRYPWIDQLPPPGG